MKIEKIDEIDKRVYLSFNYHEIREIESNASWALHEGGAFNKSINMVLIKQFKSLLEHPSIVKDWEDDNEVIDWDKYYEDNISKISDD